MSSGIGVGVTIAGKYRVERILGEGGMGVVFAAQHLDLGRRVAIKVMRRELGMDDSMVQRLTFEARAAARIQSEHVCRVLDVSRLEDGTPFIVMEYLEGEDLGAVLERLGTLDEVKAVDYVLQACEPLAEAHAAGIIHRDLKPENLFLAKRADGSSIIKVLDFGVSKATAASALQAHAAVTQANAAIGSPYYMAPEQMSAPSSLDQRADIWALGAILYQLTTGEVPFTGESLPEIYVAVLQADPLPPRNLRPEVSEKLEQVILRCLQGNREARFSSVAELGRALASCGGTGAPAMADRISRILRDGSQESPPSDPLADPGRGVTTASTSLSLADSRQRDSPAGDAGRRANESFGLLHSATPHVITTILSRARTRTGYALAGAVLLGCLFVLLLVMRRAPRASLAPTAVETRVAGTLRAGVPAPQSTHGGDVTTSGKAERLEFPALETPISVPRPAGGAVRPVHSEAGDAATDAGSKPRPHAAASTLTKVRAQPRSATAPTLETDDPFNPDNFGGRR